MTDKQENLETEGRKLSWLRITGLAAAVGVHAAALVLMLVPVAPPQNRPSARRRRSSRGRDRHRRRLKHRRR
jgi:hypothetical protein